MEPAEAARKEERARIADALHDDVLPSLAVLRQDVLEGVDAITAAQAVDRAIAAVRELIVAEHPVIAERQDLEDALHAVAAPVCARAGLTLAMNVDDLAGGRRDERAVVLAGVRELVENVARHAAASTVTIACRPIGDGWLVEVADDGAGIEPELIRERREAGHLGLVRLADRVQAVGGQLDVTSGVNGTRVTLRF